MISDEIACLADRCAGYGAKRRSMEPEVASVLAAHLAYLAQRVAVLEATPFVARITEDKR